MSSTAQTGIDIHPFQVEIPDEALDDLRGRIAATRWPSKELVGDRSQGVQLATLQAQAYPTLAYFNKIDRGGHFAAWEEPELFATERCEPHSDHCVNRSTTSDGGRHEQHRLEHQQLN